MAARKAMGLTQADVARSMKAGGFAWHQQTVQRFETGERPPRLNEAHYLAWIVESPLSDLLQGDPVDHAGDLWRLGSEQVSGVMMGVEDAIESAVEGEPYFQEISDLLGAEAVSDDVAGLLAGAQIALAGLQGYEKQLRTLLVELRSLSDAMAPAEAILRGRAKSESDG